MKLVLDRAIGQVCEAEGCDHRVVPNTHGGHKTRFCSQRCRDRHRWARIGRGEPAAATPTQMVAWVNVHRPALLPFPLGWKVMLADRVAGEGATVELALRAAMDATTPEAA